MSYNKRIGCTPSHSRTWTYVCVSSGRFDGEGTTCFTVQQMRIFDLTFPPSACGKPRLEFENTTPVQMLAYGAAKCCKSKKVDRSVCKFDECLSAMSLCFAWHNDFEFLSGKITNPKGMQTNDEGQLEGDCALAILNGVERELCCTAGMKGLPACVNREVGDYKLCKDSWNAAFEPTFFDTAVAIDKAFQPGGYCVAKSGLQSSTATPCESKAGGEFLPAEM